MLPMTEQLFGGDEFIFQHNLAPTLMPNPLKLKSQVVYHVWDAGLVLVGKLSGSYFHRKSLENLGKEDGCLSTDYFGAVKVIHEASLELHRWSNFC